MEFAPQSIPGCYVIGLTPVVDDRGFFARAFSSSDFADLGLEGGVSQVNISQSLLAGTTRGIHWQVEPHAEAKLVRCIRGRVFDVCVDLRPDSATFRQWVGVELTDENHLALYIPPGCGHAHQTLVTDSEVLYLTSVPYEPIAERGARWDDPAFSIQWPLNEGVIVSDKDRGWPAFSVD